jgi:hypothetical protein
MSFFLFYKIREQESRTSPVPGEVGGGYDTIGKGRWQGKGIGVWTWYEKCVYMYTNAKIISVEIIPGMRGEGNKGEK